MSVELSCQRSGYGCGQGNSLSRDQSQLECMSLAILASLGRRCVDIMNRSDGEVSQVSESGIVSSIASFLSLTQYWMLVESDKSETPSARSHFHSERGHICHSGSGPC